MPHQIIEYSRNLEDQVDIGDLVQALHDIASTIPVVPLANLRTRAAARDFYQIADGQPDNAFVNVTLRLAPGHTQEEKNDAGTKLFQALCDYLEPVYASSPLTLSYEIQELDAELRWQQNNIPQYMKRRQN
jgi:5-carboxymethyl-2-hydroxymuconate isomerase